MIQPLESRQADQASLARIARGDQAAFAELYDRHARLVYSLRVATAGRCDECHISTRHGQRDGNRLTAEGDIQRAQSGIVRANGCRTEKKRDDDDRNQQTQVEPGSPSLS